MSPIRRLAVTAAAATMLVLPAAGAASAVLPDGYDGAVEATDEPSITMMPLMAPPSEPTLMPIVTPEATNAPDSRANSDDFTNAVRNTLQSMPWFTGGNG